MGKTQTILTEFDRDGFEKREIPLNALIASFPDEGINLHIAKIEGNFKDNPKQHIARYASNKFDFASAGYFKDKHVFLVGINKFTRIEFTKNRTKFRIIPLDKKINLNLGLDMERNSIVELVLNNILKQFKNQGFEKIRTSSGRHVKESLINATAPVFSKKEGVYWYHAFEGFLLRVKVYKNTFLLIILDCIYHVLRTTFDTSTSFKEMFENDGRWMSTKLIPQKIRDALLPVRKMDGKKRLEKDLNLLKKVNLYQIGITEVIPFCTSEIIKLKEPAFLFGKNFKIQIPEDEELSTFLLANFKKLGIHKLPKPIRVQPIIMNQLSNLKNRMHIKLALKKLVERYQELFHQKLIILDEIILREADDQVEEESKKLRKRYPKDFDIVLGILKGKAYNHVFRKAIKKGLQNVPSQIIKFYKLNSLNIFKDVYAPSILSQIFYKSRGVIISPIDESFLKNFSVRIFYDIGKFYSNEPASPGKRKLQTIVGTASLITHNQVYKFQQASKINDVGLYEKISRKMIREIITKVVGMYLKAVKKSSVEDNIIIQRDGKSSEDEFDEAEEVIDLFKSAGFIDQNCKWVFVEFIKKPILRLFDYTPSFNPRRGSLLVLDESSAILTTTGYPDIHKKERKESHKVGVAIPLEIRRVDKSTNSIFQ